MLHFVSPQHELTANKYPVHDREYVAEVQRHRRSKIRPTEQPARKNQPKERHLNNQNPNIYFEYTYWTGQRRLTKRKKEKRKKNEAHPKRPPSGLNLHTDTVLFFLRSNALRRCLESLSQKWKFPSEPAVAKVPYLWKAIEFTEYTAAWVPCRVTEEPRRRRK